MESLSPEERIKLLEKEVERLQKLRNVYHGKGQFTEKEVSDLKTLLTVMKWMSGVMIILAGIEVTRAVQDGKAEVRMEQTTEAVKDIKSNMQTVQNNAQAARNIAADSNNKVSDLKRDLTNWERRVASHEKTGTWITPDESGTP